MIAAGAMLIRTMSAILAAVAATGKRRIKLANGVGIVYSIFFIPHSSIKAYAARQSLSIAAALGAG